MTMTRPSSYELTCICIESCALLQIRQFILFILHYLNVVQLENLGCLGQTSEVPRTY